MGRPCRHAATIGKRGALSFVAPSAWRQGLARLGVGTAVWVTVTRQSSKASHSQHGYYRGEVLPFLAEEWGWGDPAELHHELKVKHLPGIIPVEEWPRRKFGTEWQVEVPSSATFSVEQFSAFLDAVLHQAADAGCPVPPPRGTE